ncbi:MAG: isoprenylcysteine carboxylmethyltransferase family protein [Gemmatimonadaceae bacterium]
MNGLLWRAVLAFFALPGTMAFLIPLLLLRPTGPGHSFTVLGLIPLSLGVGLLFWCVREFYVAGKGTLAPWALPQKLVITGLYQFSRNPMYIAVLLVLCGWALGFRSRSLVIYALVVMLAFHLRVVFGEEPWLLQTHGEDWIRYKARVPRWFGFRRRVD